MIDTFLSGIFLFSALAILGGLLALLARLRAGEGARVHLPADGGIWGTLLPGLALVVLVAATLGLMMDRSTSTPALVVKLTAYQFGWKSEYFASVPSQDQGRTDQGTLRALGVSTTDHLVLPLGIDTLILATSSDVIHRLEVPALDLRKDLIPGLVSEFRVHPSQGGRFLLLSDGLCGASLGLMAAPVTVVDLAAFQEWLGRPEALISGPGGIGESLES